MQTPIGIIFLFINFIHSRFKFLSFFTGYVFLYSCSFYREGKKNQWINCLGKSVWLYRFARLRQKVKLPNCESTAILLPVKKNCWSTDGNGPNWNSMTSDGAVRMDCERSVLFPLHSVLPQLQVTGNAEQALKPGSRSASSCNEVRDHNNKVTSWIDASF